MKKIAILLLVAAIAVLAGCQDAPATDICEETETATQADYMALSGYLEAFGHVRVLGDLDHLFKGEKVNDEECVTVPKFGCAVGAVEINGKEGDISLV